MDDMQLLRYSRHILLPEIGIEGQQAIRAARVLAVGAGGLGSPAACYLAAAGVGTLVLADDDVVDLTNLQRQILHRTTSVGEAKAVSGQRTLHELNPECNVIALTERLTGERLRDEVMQAEVVLDCSDNFATRHAINRACVATKTPLVSGAAIRMEGQISVFTYADGEPCYRCLSRLVGENALTCVEAGVMAPLVGVIGSLQAMEAIKVLAHYGTPAAGKIVMYDAMTCQFREMKLMRNPGCEVCGG